MGSNWQAVEPPKEHTSGPTLYQTRRSARAAFDCKMRKGVSANGHWLARQRPDTVRGQNLTRQMMYDMQVQGTMAPPGT